MSVIILLILQGFAFIILLNLPLLGNSPHLQWIAIGGATILSGISLVMAGSLGCRHGRSTYRSIQELTLCKVYTVAWCQLSTMRGTFIMLMKGIGPYPQLYEIPKEDIDPTLCTCLFEKKGDIPVKPSLEIRENGEPKLMLGTARG